jgi:hypothetical protein
VGELRFRTFGWRGESPHGKSDQEGWYEENPGSEGDPLGIDVGEGNFAEFIVVGLVDEGLIV